jgi:hypothetical protein
VLLLRVIDHRSGVLFSIFFFFFLAVCILNVFEHFVDAEAEF